MEAGFAAWTGLLLSPFVKRLKNPSQNRKNGSSE
jgi:hypothetical protein